MLSQTKQWLCATLALTFLAVATASAEDTPTTKPNVLMIAVDDLNDWIGVNGPAGHPQTQTPNLDRLARRGVYFANAHTAVPVCMASRLALFSGLRASTTGHYSNHAVAEQSILRKATLLPACLRQHGYWTMGGGKLYHHGTDSKTGSNDWDQEKLKYAITDDWIEQAHGYGGRGMSFFLPFPDGGSPIVRRHGKVSGYSLCGGPLDRDDMPRGIMPDEELADWAVERLQEDHQQPFFLAIGFARPHVPYTAPREFFEQYDADSMKIPAVPNDEFADIPIFGKAMALCTLPGGDHYFVTNKMGPDYWRELVHAYLACVSFVDAQVGRVLDALETSGHADNTIIVLWSDHGQHLGEKKHWRKMCLWEESTRVPMVWVLPDGRNAGRACRRPVSLLDVYPTLVELLHLPLIDALEGESLVPLLMDPDSPRETPAISTWHFGNHSVRSELYRYIRYRDGTEELYDHQADRGEHKNLASDPEYAEVLAAHQKWVPQENVVLSDDPDIDSLGRRVRQWKENPNQVPAWLQ
jgi:arylsulfatase A-like enzyme